MIRQMLIISSMFIGLVLMAHEESYSRTYLCDTLGNCIASPDSVVKVTNSAIFQSHSYFSASTVSLTTGNIEKFFL